MRTTTQQFANALRKGIEANFAPENQAAEREKLSELLTEMAASLEMDSIVNHTGLVAPGKKMKYANLLGEISWALSAGVTAP